MKKILLSLLFTGFIGLAWTQIKMPAASPKQTISQDFALSSIQLSYSRPGLKGRNLFGDQIPWNVLWRTGANTATLITFGDEVEVLGHKVPAGQYAIYTIPEADGQWTFILNSGVKNFGVDSYQQSEDLFRQTIAIDKYPAKAETMTMQFSDVKPERCVLNIRWDDFGLRIPIESHFQEKLRKQFETVLSSDAEKKPYYQAATFYHDYEHDNAKALELVNKAISSTPNPQYWVVYFKAKVQQEIGDTKAALETAYKALEVARDAKSENYIILNEALIKDLQ